MISRTRGSVRRTGNETGVNDWWARLGHRETCINVRGTSCTLDWSWKLLWTGLCRAGAWHPAQQGAERSKVTENLWPTATHTPYSWQFHPLGQEICELCVHGMDSDNYSISPSLMSDSATPWTVAPLSMEFSRQEYWSGLPFPFPRDLPDPGIKPQSPASQADSLLSEPPGEHNNNDNHTYSKPRTSYARCRW